KTHPNSWLNSTIGVVTITTMLMNVCFADDQSKKEVAQAQKEAENARDRANKSGIELEQEQQKTEQEKQKTEQEKQKTSNIETSNQIKVEQEKQKTSNIETSNQIKVEQEKQKTSNIETSNQIKVEQEQQKTEQERQKTIKTQKDFIKYAEQNCKENHGRFLIEKGGTKADIGGITIEAEAECKTPKPTKTNQTPIQPKHLPNSKQPRSQRGSKAQELIAY
ncbi:DUF874 family protein, partial [Helicobacter pylori]|uniref:DUF874 family protein n=1 Tax=Helicobacter pylori TaxID=210 RepID=UPI000EAFFF8C